MGTMSHMSGWMKKRKVQHIESAEQYNRAKNATAMIMKKSAILSAVKILKLANLKETMDPADTPASWNSPAAPVNQTNHGR